MVKTYFILLLCCCLSLHSQAIHFFEGDYQAALQKAKAENKNVFICFSATWCGPCKMMKKLVFTDERIIAYTDKHFVSLYLDIDIQENEILQKRISPQFAGGVPYLCILSPEEEVLKEHPSTMSVSQMRKFLQLKPNQLLHRKLQAAPEAEEAPQLFQNKDTYAEILQKSRETGKNMLLYFSSHYCGPCRQMQKSTFSNEPIIKYTEKNYITGRFDIDRLEDRKLCVRYHNQQGGIPYLVIATPEEKILRSHTGYMDSTSFMNFVKSEDTGTAVVSILPADSVHFTEYNPTLLSRFFYQQYNSPWKLEVICGIHATTLRTTGALSDLDFNYRVGYEAGIAFNRVGKHFRLCPGISFISKGGKTKDYTVRQNYLEMPVKFGWIFHNSYRGWYQCLDVTPYGSVRVGHKVKNHRSDLPDHYFETDKFDYGLRFALHAKFGSGEIEGGYNLGLHNISSYSGGGMYNRGFFLNIALSFGG